MSLFLNQKQPEIPTQHAVELIDILTLLFQRFPARITSRPALQSACLTALLSLLSSSRTHIRKRAIISLGYLLPVSESKVFDSLSQSLEMVLQEGTKNDPKKVAYAQLVGGLAKVMPGRVGPILNGLINGILGLTFEMEDEEAVESGLTVSVTMGIGMGSVSVRTSLVS
jgi:hypothetical protein